MICSVIFAVAMVSVVHAEAITFEADVSASKVPLGVPFRLILTVKGTQDVPAPALGAMNGCDVQFIGPSTQVSVVNGQYSAMKSFNYRLTPLKEGALAIPAAELRTRSGEVYHTQPLTVEVLPSQAVIEGDQGASSDIGKKVKLVMMVPRRVSYVNELFPVAFKLYVDGVTLNDITFPVIAGEGFQQAGFSKPRRSEEVVDGIRYQVIEFMTAVMPTRSGQLSVGPALIEASIPVRESRQDTSGGMFEDDLFRGFFSSYRKQPVRVSSEPFALEVRPLPEDGKPKDFSGAVGKYEMDAQASPLELKVGDPVTVRATVRGGDLKTVKLQPVKADGFKSYDPSVKEEGQSLVFEQVLIPTIQEARELPAVSFSYFDPQEGQYKTITKGPFSLKVEPPPPGEEFKAVGFSGEVMPSAENFGKDIVFIKDKPGRFLAKDRQGPGILFYILLILYLNIWGALFGYRFHQRRLEQDEAYARRVKAPAIAGRRVKELRALIESGDGRGFCDGTQALLREFLGDMAGVSPSETAGAGGAVLLRSKGLDDVLVADIRRIDEACEMVRFASSGMSRETMEELLELLARCLKEVERILR